MSEHKKNRRRGPRPPPPQFACPILSCDEYEAVCVPMTQLEDPERGVKAIMEEHGFCIVPDAISAEKAAALEDIMSRELLSLVNYEEMAAQKHKVLQKAWNRAQQEGVGAWPEGSLKKMGKKNRFQFRGLPHSQFAWECRLDPNVRRVYEVLHDTSELISSCDNSFVGNRAAEAQEQNVAWPHVDQNDSDANVAPWDVYQGLVYVWSSESEHSSTTVVWPKSHKSDTYHHYLDDAGLARRGARGQHFTPLHNISKDSPTYHVMEQGWLQQARRVTVPAGGLLLWSSRTTHQGWSGGPRLAQPVCWEPTERRTEESKHRKYVLAALGLPSTHWASLGQPHHLVPQTPTPAVQALHSSIEDCVVFALKPCLKSFAVKDDVDPAAMWDKLGSVDLEQPLTDEVKDILEKSLKDEFKTVL